MISHIFIGTNDRDRAIRFYATVMDALGWRRRVSETTPHLAIWHRRMRHDRSSSSVSPMTGVKLSRATAAWWRS